MLSDLELLTNRVKNSLILNTTSEVIAGPEPTVGLITLQHSAASIVSIESFDESSRAPVKLLDPASDYTHVSGSADVTLDTDQSANLLRISYSRSSI